MTVLQCLFSTADLWTDRYEEAKLHLSPSSSAMIFRFNFDEFAFPAAAEKSTKLIADVQRGKFVDFSFEPI